VKIIPARRRPDEFHEGKSAHEIRPPRGEMEGERRSPVLSHQVSGIDAEAFDEGIEIARLIGKAVGDVGLAGLTEANQVRRDATRDRRDQRHDVAPNVGRGRIAVQEQRDGRAARSGFAPGHGASQHVVMTKGDIGGIGHDGSLNTV
jgi:hypothetical protein